MHKSCLLCAKKEELKKPSRFFKTIVNEIFLLVSFSSLWGLLFDNSPQQGPTISFSLINAAWRERFNQVW